MCTNSVPSDITIVFTKELPSCSAFHDSLTLFARWPILIFSGRKLKAEYISFVSLKDVKTVHIAGTRDISDTITRRTKNVQYMTLPLKPFKSEGLSTPVVLLLNLFICYVPLFNTCPLPCG